MHGYYHICTQIYITVFSPVNVNVLFTSVPSFLPMLLLKVFHFLLVVKFPQVDIISFPSCHLPQVNHCQNIILCLIKKDIYRNRNKY